MTWQRRPLGEIAELQAGVGFPPALQGRLEGELALAKVGDISRAVRAGGLGFVSPLNHITRAEAEQLRARIFPPGSTVFAKIGEAIAQNFRLFTDREAALDNNAMGAIPRNGVEPRYLFRFLQTVDLYAYSSKTTVPSLRKSELERIVVPLPPIDEQRRIADILDKADAIRRKRKEAIALTDELLRSAFLEMFGDPTKNPKGWNVVPFRNVVRETQLGLVRAASLQGPERAFPYVRMNAIRASGRLDLGGVTRVDATAAEVEVHRLERGDFLFNTRNSKELVGKAAVFNEEGTYLFNNNILRVRFREGVESDFMNSYWQTNAAQRELDARKAGTTSVFAIYYKNLATVPVPVPPPDAQARYAALCASVRAMRRTQRSAEQFAEELFRTLVQRCFGRDGANEAAVC
ncbi:MAG: restriction endonuclease subunit S [Myxococcales bacterium]|nr:restriction endonuclease subunit S [Myxococcales bacterium]